jgi:hypothetical protein
MKERSRGELNYGHIVDLEPVAAAPGELHHLGLQRAEPPARHLPPGHHPCMFYTIVVARHG